jgi:hypothetical protein
MAGGFKTLPYSRFLFIYFVNYLQPKTYGHPQEMTKE